MPCINIGILIIRSNIAKKWFELTSLPIWRALSQLPSLEQLALPIECAWNVAVWPLVRDSIRTCTSSVEAKVTEVNASSNTSSISSNNLNNDDDANNNNTDNEETMATNGITCAAMTWDGINYLNGRNDLDDYREDITLIPHIVPLLHRTHAVILIRCIYINAMQSIRLRMMIRCDPY
jgi:hypothetical protein